MAITAGIGIVTLPVMVGAVDLAYQKLFNSSLDPHHLLTYSGHEQATDASWSPDGTRVASTGWDAAVQVWDATTGKKLLSCTLEKTVTGVSPLGVVWSANGKYLFAFFGEYTLLSPESNRSEKRIVGIVQVWDAVTGQRVRSIPIMQPTTITGPYNDTVSLDPQPNLMTWALNEQYLAVAISRRNAANTRDDIVIEIWDLATGSKVSLLDPASPPISPPGNSTPIPSALYSVVKMVWAHDSGKLAVSTTGQSNNMCQVWDALVGKKMHTFPVVYQADDIIAWSLDGRSIALGTAIYDAETGRRGATYWLEGSLTSQGWSPNGKDLAVSTERGTGLYAPTYGTLSLIDASSGKQIAQYDEGQVDRGSFKKTTWSPSGKDFLVVRKGIEIWRADEGSARTQTRSCGEV
ncbi:MAG TPA: WD40 repeat domain-containing protein [Ktedonobacteraceae bacterium]|nr:WD40 repeat domain-containing protein [Ktedonobacteraceae bacterium]